MKRTNQKNTDLNPFFRFFHVLSRLVVTLPRKTKRTVTLVCLGLIVLGIITSSAAMPSDPAPPAQPEQTEQAVEPTVPATLPPTQPVTQSVGHRIDGVPIVVQDFYKAGCETYAATMLLQGLGYNITEHQFVDNYLILHDFSYDDEGNMYGPDMNSAFAGSIFTGAGIFCPAMAKSMNRYLETQNTKLRAVAVKGKTLEELCREYVDRDIPVMTWVTTYMDESYDRFTWIVDYVDENAELKIGDEQTWRQNEHCMVLIGYTEDEYIFCDSVAGKEVSHSKALSETRFKEIGNQAVVVLEP